MMAWFSDVSHDIGGENRMRCDEQPGAVAVAERHFVRVRGHRAVRDRFHAIGHRIATGQHGDHSWPADRVAHLDLQDLRVRVGRTHEIRVGLTRYAEIVCVLPRAGEQPWVLATQHRFPDALRGMALTGRQKRHRALSSKWVLAGVYAFPTTLGSLGFVVPGRPTCEKAFDRRLLNPCLDSLSDASLCRARAARAATAGSLISVPAAPRHAPPDFGCGRERRTWRTSRADLSSHKPL